MIGTVTTPKFWMECIHCKKKQFTDLTYEVDVPTENLPWVQDSEFEIGGVMIKEGSIISGICPRCVALGLPFPDSWEEVGEEEE